MAYEDPKSGKALTALEARLEALRTNLKRLYEVRENLEALSRKLHDPVVDEKAQKCDAQVYNSGHIGNLDSILDEQAKVLDNINYYINNLYTII